MARYTFEVYNKDAAYLNGTTGSRRCYILADEVVAVSKHEELNGEHTLEITLVQTGTAAEHIAEGRMIHVYDHATDPVGRTRFVIESFESSRSEAGQLLMTVSCIERSMWMLMSEVCRQRFPWDDVTADDALAHILDYGRMTGNIDDGTLSATRVSIELDYQTRLEAVQELAAKTDSVFYMTDADEDNIINLVPLADYGTTKPYLINYAKNLKHIRKITDWTNAATELIPLGGGDPPLDTTKHRLRVSGIEDRSLDSLTDLIFLEEDDTWAIPSDDSYKEDDQGYDLYVTCWDTQHQHANADIIVSVLVQATHTLYAPNGTPAIEIPEDTITGWSGTPDYVSFTVAENRPGIDWVGCKTAIDARGAVVKAFRDEDLPPVLNMAMNATMDDPETWIGGKCRPWETIGIGAPTFTKNTNSYYIMHGKASMRVRTWGASEGCRAKVYYTEGRSGKENVDYVAAKLWVYHVAGTVQVEILRNGPGAIAPFPPLGDEALITENGWNEIVLESVDPQTALPDKYVYVQLSQDGAVNSEFYIDAYQVEPYASASEPFYGVSGAWTFSWAPTELFKRASTELLTTRSGVVSYEISVADLAAQFPNDYDSDSFAVGDTVGVRDDALDIDTDLRVITKTTDLLEPINCTVRVSTLPRSFIDMLAATVVDAGKAERRETRQTGRVLTTLERKSPGPGFVIRKAIDSETSAAFRGYEEYSRWSE